ncbi:MAG: rhamnulose-1-phosphate aldolase, partial [Treponema sp.]|nr:rhamnulose-1-phosphate aldolase [Treponema sp.]
MSKIEKITDIPVIQGFVRMCKDAWLQGWHERNGGNLTYRMTANDVDQCRVFFGQPGEWTAIGVSGENLAGEYFITTGSGKYFRNVELDTSANIGIVEINEKGGSWRVVCGHENARPTSEFPTHLMSHAVRKKATNGRNRVIYHAHPANIVAMTYILPLTAKDFSLALWQSETECPVVFPEGVGVVPWQVPGGTEIAAATAKIMERYSAAVWAHHGLFCSGADFDETFGLMHTIEKAAEIYMKVISTGLPVRQTIS